MTLKLRPDSIPDSAWTEPISYTCCLCGGSLDTDEHLDLVALHDPECAGCPLCEIPIRLFKELPDGRVLGVVMHFSCFEKILEP